MVLWIDGEGLLCVVREEKKRNMERKRRERESERESERAHKRPQRGGETPRHDVSSRLSQERRKNVNLNPFGPEFPSSIPTLALGCQGFKQFSRPCFSRLGVLGDTLFQGQFEPRPGPSGASERFGEARSALLCALNEVEDLSEALQGPFSVQAP